MSKTIATGYRQHLGSMKIGTGMFAVIILGGFDYFLDVNVAMNERAVFYIAVLLGSIFPDLDVYKKGARVFTMNSSKGAFLISTATILIASSVWLYFEGNRYWWVSSAIAPVYLTLCVIASKRMQHRGISHGVFGIIIGSLIIAGVLSQYSQVFSYYALWGAFIGINTHIITDYSGSNKSMNGLYTFKTKGVIYLLLLTGIANSFCLMNDSVYFYK